MTEIELVAPHRHWNGTRLDPVGVVRFADPVVESVTAPPGNAVQLTVALDNHAAGTHVVAAFVRLDFANPAVVATELRIMAADRPLGSVPTSVSVLGGGRYGWLLGDPLGSVPIPGEFTVHALLPVPGRAAGPLTVTARVDATMLGTGRWWRSLARSHVRCLHPAEFVVALPGPGAIEPADDHPPMASKYRRGMVRLCLAADIERFSRFRMPEATRAQQRFVDVMAQAREHAEIDESAVELQESGDGQFAVLPAGVDESMVLPRLIEGLRIALAQVNTDLNAHARLRLRVAMHRGHVAPGANGWVGETSIAIHRILDSEPVRAALATNESSDFALIVPEVLYREVVSQRYAWLNPDEFVQTEVALPAKGFTAPAWVYVPRH